jgi:hypothetical protein
VNRHYIVAAVVVVGMVVDTVVVAEAVAGMVATVDKVVDIAVVAAVRGLGIVEIVCLSTDILIGIIATEL